MRSSVKLVAAGAALVVCSALGAEANPLQKNLKVLEARARAAKAPKPKPEPVVAAPRAPRVARRVYRPRVRMARAITFNREQHSEPAAGASRFVSYTGERFGSKPRGGDLIVTTTGVEGLTHVYVGTRIVSNGGSGHARVPDMAPGKHPIMVWSPESGKRRTYWIKIRSGSVAELSASL